MNINVVNYVRRFFKLNCLTFYNHMSKKEVDSVIYSICEELLDDVKDKSIKDKSEKVKKIINGNKDKFIYKTINSFVEQMKPNLWADCFVFKKNIRNSISSNNFVNYSNVTFNCIVERILDELYSEYDYQLLMDGKIDKKISIAYTTVVRQLCNEMREYIKKYIIKNIYPMNNVDEVAIAEDFVKFIMTQKECNASQLLLGNYNDLIVQKVAYFRKKKIESRPNSIDYIYNRLKGLDNNNCDENELIQYAVRIDENLRSRYIFPEDLVGHKHDGTIDKMYCGFMMRRNSVKRDDVPDKVEHKTKTIKIPYNLIKIIGVGVLSLAISVPVGMRLMDEIKLFNANKTVSMVDDFDYSGIHTSRAEKFEPMAENVLQFYDDFKEYGDENFYHLGFYRAYNNVKEDRLAIMDKMLSVVKNKARNDEKYADYFNSLSGCSCYLEYMCERLEAMGCSEITDNKYQNAVTAYRSAHFRANPDQTAMDVLESEGNDKVIGVINEIRNLYIEYSEDWLIELAGVMNNSNKTDGKGMK